jgi:anti-anti-sigma regulatory factor
MAANFKISVSKNNGSLHLKLSGHFDGTSAHELLNFLKNHSGETSQIFVHTNNLSDLNSFGLQIFRNNIGSFNKHSDRLVFTGENASQFAFK